MKRRTLITALLLTLLPALTGFLIIFSATTPQEESASVRAAVVNLDVPATTADGTTLPAGRLLLGRLTDPQAALTAESRTASEELALTTLDYSVVGADTAEEGLTDGTYDVVITIPADFSSSMASTLDGTPARAPITIETARSASAEVRTMSQSAVDDAATSLGTTITLSYLTGSLEGMTTLSTSLDEAATGASSLSEGVSSYTGAVDSLRTTVTTADPSTGYDLAGGAGAAASGAAQAHELCVASHGASDPTCQALTQVAGATSAVSGAIGSSTDVYDPATGTGRSVVGVLNTLSSQSSTLTNGASSISTGLTEAADSVPSYDEEEVSSLAEGLSQPVSVDSSSASQVRAADGAAPAACAIALWIGALVTVHGLGVMSRRAVESAAAPGRLAWRSLRPALGLSVLQGLMLVGAMAVAGIALGNAAALTAVLVLGAVTMTLLHAALTAGLGGRAGIAVSLLALVLQVAALGSAAPSGGVGDLLAYVRGIAPLNIAVDALSTVMAGSGGGSGMGLWACVALLVVWAAAGGAVAVLAVRRRRSTSLGELRQQLAEA